MKKKFTIITMFVVFVAMDMSCKKFVDVNPPKTEILTAQAFSNDNSATSAVLGIYANIQNDNNFLNSGVTIYAGLSADELLQFYTDPYSDQFQQNQLQPNNYSIGSMWSAAYQNMAQINTCIAGLEASSGLSPDVKAQLLGESKFDRAFINFYLVNLFGNIPLVNTTDYKKNAVIGQSKPADVYNFIIADLKDAQTEMTDSYPTAGKVRPNKWAATALLARVYLYINDFANAEIQSSAIIASGRYGPLPTLNAAFLKGSNEAIWEILPTASYSATQEGAAILQDIAYGNPGYYLTDNLINSFETGDQRKLAWVDTISNSGQLYYYPYKYKDPGQYGGTNITENYIMLRVSEQYLIRAEARVQLGKQADALADVNVIRRRAGLNNLTTTDKNTLINAVANENRHEFFSEWGHRWLDVKRSGKATIVLSPVKPAWKSTAEFYPIPQTEITLDKQLVQNPGY